MADEIINAIMSFLCANWYFLIKEVEFSLGLNLHGW